MFEGKYIWKALRRHVEGNHTFRVSLVQDGSNDFQVECVWCGVPLLAGSPAMVDHIRDVLTARGIRVVRPLNQPQVRLQ